MRRKRTRRSGRPTFRKDRAGSGDHAKLYGLIFNRALASQMASARLERTTVELTDGAGAATLRATGQVVLFPGFMRSTTKAATRRPTTRTARRMPQLRAGDAPVKNGVEATQHFTQPPPRYSEASLVKRLEELGIGRPSTYAATLQTLKDREYVRLDKNRFIPEESGRLVTAFLERFFERYVNYDYTAELEEELDDVSGGRLDWQKAARGLLARLQAQGRRGDGAEAVGRHGGARRFPVALALPRQGRRQRSAAVPAVRHRPAGLRGGKFGAFVACSNYPECKYTRRFGQGEEAASEGRPRSATASC